MSSELNTFTVSDEPIEDEDEKFDFSMGEDVLIYIEQISDIAAECWDDVDIVSITIIKSPECCSGAASYEQMYGGFLDYVIKDLVAFPGLGWFTVTDITGDYSRGDGYETDDDMQFYCSGIRKATPEEISLA